MEQQILKYRIHKISPMWFVLQKRKKVNFVPVYYYSDVMYSSDWDELWKLKEKLQNNIIEL